jgi:hypothetical protein
MKFFLTGFKLDYQYIDFPPILPVQQSIQKRCFSSIQKTGYNVNGDYHHVMPR